MKRNYFIVVLAHPVYGRIKRLHIPHYFMHIGAACIVLAAITAVGLSASYARMFLKTAEFNKIRSEKMALQKQYDELRAQAEERDLQVASLGNLASEVSIAFGIRRDHGGELAERADWQVSRSMNQYDFLQGVQQPMARDAVLARLSNTTPSIWPVKGRISSGFGKRIDPFLGKGAFHSGIDLSAPRGTAVIATADGVVTDVGWSGGYGNRVVVNHGSSGLTTVYAHLTEMFARQGQVVRRGEVIGRAGATGRATGSHLHYEVRYKGVPVNPYKYLKSAEPQAGGFLLAD